MKFNTSLGIKNKAWQVLYALKDYEDSDKGERVETFAWYNGREGGICISVLNNITHDKRLNIAFGENRNSDDIFVDVWVGKNSINPPQHTDPEYDDGWKNRQYFKHNESEEAAEYIYSEIKCYCFLEEENGK